MEPSRDVAFGAVTRTLKKSKRAVDTSFAATFTQEKIDSPLVPFLADCGIKQEKAPHFAKKMIDEEITTIERRRS